MHIPLEWWPWTPWDAPTSRTTYSQPGWDLDCCQASQSAGYTVGGLETETCRHCTGNHPSKVTALPIVSSHGVVSWAACASWKACYPFWFSSWTTFNISQFFALYSTAAVQFAFREMCHYKNSNCIVPENSSNLQFFYLFVCVLTKFHWPSTNTFCLAGFESLAVFSMIHIVKT